MKFGWVASNWRAQHFCGLNDTFGVDQESTANVHSTCFIVDFVERTNFPALVRDHWEWYIMTHHLA